MASSFSCPSCGHEVPVGTPTCGNCGTNLQAFSVPQVPLAAGSGGFGRFARFLVSLAVVAGVVYASQTFLADLIDSDTPGAPNGRNPNDVVIGFGSVEEAISEINAAGLSCRQPHVDSSDDTVETGSCQLNGNHVQINVYFTPAGMEFAEDFYADYAFAYVHEDNWWISSNAQVARRIRRAVGGELYVPGA